MVKHKDGATYICLDHEDAIDLSAYLEDIPELQNYRVISNPMRNQYAMYQDTRPLHPNEYQMGPHGIEHTPVLSITMLRLCGTI